METDDTLDYDESAVVDSPDNATASVKLVAPNCNGGHCGCYYTNCNRCCRCGKYQQDRKMLERSIPWEEQHYQEIQRKKRMEKQDMLWLDVQ